MGWGEYFHWLHIPHFLLKKDDFLKTNNYKVRPWMTKEIFSGSQVIEPTRSKVYPETPILEEKPTLLELEFKPVTTSSITDGYTFIDALQKFINASTLLQAIPREDNKKRLIRLEYSETMKRLQFTFNPKRNQEFQFILGAKISRILGLLWMTLSSCFSKEVNLL